MNEFQARVLECALAYAEKGWPVLPLHSIRDGVCTCGKSDCASPGKHPATKNGVRDASADAEVIRKWFGGGRLLNVGICAGPVSGLVVLDVDPLHGGDASVQRLSVPATLEAATGGGGRHFYFACPKGRRVRNSVGRIGPGLDVRSDGGYVVAPPSAHASGHEYRWKVDPRAIEPAACPAWLADEGAGDDDKPQEAPPDDGPIPQGQRNSTLASIAGAMRRKGCGADEINTALVAVNRGRCRPPLGFEELRRIAESIANYPPKAADGIVLPDDHHDTIAAAFEAWSEVKHRHHIETWTVVRDRRYHRVDEREIRKWIRRFAAQCRVRRRIRTEDGFATVTEKLKVTPHVVRGVAEALSAAEGVWIRPRHVPPAWLDEAEGRPEAADVVAMEDCLLDISGAAPARMELTEAFYTLNRLPHAYDPQAQCPQWLRFLGQVFRTRRLSSEQSQWSAESDDFVEVYEHVPDALSASVLQEFMGLLLTAVTRYQKILGLVGPRRSGKGTVGRIIRALVGAGSVASPTLASLTNEHGLQSLYGKTVALIGDASISGSNADTARAVERLKSISGEDSQQINPKGKAYIEVDKLDVRFVIMANELQKLTDPTGALAGRFIYLITTQSFEGREDVHLEERLLKELPGIFNWALEGYCRLKKRGRFEETDAGREARAMAEELGSPVIAFVREWCRLRSGAMTKPQDLYEAYGRWTVEAGRGKMGRTRFYEEFQRAFPDCARSKVRASNSGTGPVWMFGGVELETGAGGQWL
ncbi:MAG: bifunctional DNA primase/polymerase [Phycisphaerae bacterium]|nr:bifunctional DNA primase/polymerase [Phycisphaerae bacterium]